MKVTIYIVCEIPMNMASHNEDSDYDEWGVGGWVWLFIKTVKMRSQVWQIHETLKIKLLMITLENCYCSTFCV
jgi:hypothetical protein